ncbi:MAG: hypothetical protein O3B22_17210 [Proteobacteria bacterium]|nr:hypothetical protein [Pseudomonadota bacterium]
MSGTLNQDVEGLNAPIDVKDQLREIGVVVCTDVTDILNLLQVH